MSRIVRKIESGCKITRYRLYPGGPVVEEIDPFYEVNKRIRRPEIQARWDARKLERRMRYELPEPVEPTQKRGRL